MELRPCIDIHNGKVKQIVGGTLSDRGDSAAENFVSDRNAAYFAELFKKDKVTGGHVILLNGKASPYYEVTRQQALLALQTYPGGLMVGGGITDESFRKKKLVISTAIEINKPDPKDPVDVLSKVGGFDIAAMCGAFLGCAASRRPVVIDGFISSVAALCAFRLCPAAKYYFVPSHASFEIGYKLAMDAMELQPMLLLGMRLGEGSGCPIAFQILGAACAIINDMASFDQAGIDDGYLEDIRQGDKFTVVGS